MEYGMNPLISLEFDQQLNDPPAYKPPAEDPGDRISAFFENLQIEKLIKEHPMEDLCQREMQKAILGEDFLSSSSSVDVSEIKTELERTSPRQILKVAERLLKFGQTLLLFDGQIRVAKSLTGQVSWEDLTAK